MSSVATRSSRNVSGGAKRRPDAGRQSSDRLRQMRIALSGPQDAGGIGAVPTAAGGIARAAFARAEASLPDVAFLAKRAGLSLKQLKDPGIRIPVGQQIAFLNLVADRLAEEFLGFNLARDIDLRELGLLYYVQASSNTLADALRRTERYCSIQNEGVLIRYRDDGPACVSLHYNAVRRLSDRHQVEFFVTIIVRLCQQLVGRQLRPTRVRLAHRRTELPVNMAACFGCEFVFGSDVDEIEYAPFSGRLPLAAADDYLNRLLRKYCEEALASRRVHVKSWRLAVENTLAPLLPHGQGRLSEVSTKLGVTGRTLERRLAEEGVSFLRVLEDLRLELAKRYLREPNLPISEIAWLLGYADPSAFTHSFRRWTGKPPRQARAT